MARTGKFKCATCGRTFSMAAHLGRHQSTVHASRTSPKRRPTRRHTPRAGKRSPAPHAQPPVVDALGEAIAPLRACRDGLVAERAAIDAHVTVLDGLLAALGATAGGLTRRINGGQRRGQPARAGSLRTFILRALEGRNRPMRVAEIAAAVGKAGYKTRNKTLAKSVGNILATMPEVAKVARGQYGLRS